jgi:hypothetical protein
VGQKNKIPLFFESSKIPEMTMKNTTPGVHHRVNSTLGSSLFSSVTGEIRPAPPSLAADFASEA